MQCERSDLEQSLLREPECPVCMEYMVPPIIRCVNGHNICEKCRSKTPHCPTCRQEFLGTRNVTLEPLATVMKYPCSYRKYGCEEFFVHDMFREHQHRCHYRSQTCLVSKVSNVQCSWAGIYDDIKKHLKEHHPRECYEYVEEKFISMMTIFPGMILSQFVFVFNEVFFLIFHVNIHTLYAVMLYVGPSENAAKYKYKVEFVNKDNTEGATIIHLTRSFDENLGDIFKSGNCGKVHYDVVRRLRNKEGRLKFKTEIFRVGD